MNLSRIFDKNSVNVITGSINRVFGQQCEPWRVATITTAAVISSIWFWNCMQHDESIWVRGKRYFYHYLHRLPYARRKIDKILADMKNDLQNDIRKRYVDLPQYLELPEEGMQTQDLLKLMDDYLQCGDYEWREGRVSGAVYSYNKELIELLTAVFCKTLYTNPLHPDIFPGICKMEAEVIRMISALFHGNESTCGTMTSGGTESIILACKAYRDYAREYKGITRPNMVIPRTAHAAFDKAAKYFNIAIRYVNINPTTCAVDLRALAWHINSNTIMLVGSVPNFPYGTMDDIQGIAKLGLKYNIPVHVDACLGSIVVALANQFGRNIKPFDFAVKGVSSISVDTHKYGFAPKGSSVILYSKEIYRNYQYTVTTDWPGGVYGSQNINGSRAGGIIACCWATMLHFGYNGYYEACERILNTARYIENQIREIEGIFIFGRPISTVIAIGSKVFDIYRLADVLCALGWNLNNLQFPSGLHICITDMHTMPGVADNFLMDLQQSVEEIMKDPEEQLTNRMAVYGLAQQLKDRSIIVDITRCYLNTMYYIPQDEKGKEYKNLVNENKRN